MANSKVRNRTESDGEGAAVPRKGAIGLSSGNHGVRRTQRVMVYCHDSVGVGHLRRSMVICEHVKKSFPAASFLLTTGTPYVPLFNLSEGVDYLKLPALTKGEDGKYRSKFLGLRTRQLLDFRRALLLASVQSFRPSVVLVDKAPAGVCGELIPTLRWIQRNSPQTRVVFGMRDIEDMPKTTIAQWTSSGVTQILEECYDEIWVYGMESLFDVVREYRLSSRINDKLKYAGYVGRQACDHDIPTAENGKRVLVTVGGGTDGEHLLKNYLANAGKKIAEIGGHSTVIGGPDLPRDVAERLRAQADGLLSTTWIDSTSCMSCQVRRADLIVCMGGYNTLCEVVSLRKRALVVPRITPRQEQAIRATRWASMGLVDVMHPSMATPDALSSRVVEMLESRLAPGANRLDMGALKHVEERFAHFWNGNGTPRTAS